MMLHLDEVYCQFPEDEEEQTNEDGTKVHGCMSITIYYFYLNDLQFIKDWRWKYESVTQISNEVTRKLCSARPMKYKDILELDRKVRLAHAAACVSRQPGSTASYSFSPLQQCIRTLHGDAGVYYQCHFGKGTNE